MLQTIPIIKLMSRLIVYQLPIFGSDNKSHQIVPVIYCVVMWVWWSSQTSALLAPVSSTSCAQYPSISKTLPFLCKTRGVYLYSLLSLSALWLRWIRLVVAMLCLTMPVGWCYWARLLHPRTYIVSDPTEPNWAAQRERAGSPGHDILIPICQRWNWSRWICVDSM